MRARTKIDLAAFPLDDLFKASAFCLDPARREAALSLLDEVVERQGLTLVLATHRLEEAVSLCDHLLPLIEEDGVSLGTAQPLAQALGGAGAPTLVNGTLRETDETLEFCYGGQALRVKAAPFTAVTM